MSATVPKNPKDYERKRKETQCPLCTCHFRSDLLIGHMLTHKHDLIGLLDVRCRTAAIQEKLPMMFYHNSYIPKKQFDESKLFCACLICGKGKYKGGHGSVHDFLRIHRTSDCVKQWDSVAHLFGELPEGVAPLEPPAPKVSAQEAMKDRRIAQLLAVIEEKEAEDAKTSKRFTELYNEHKRLSEENITLHRQLLETQVAKVSPPTAYDFDAVAPGVPLPPAVDAVAPGVPLPPAVDAVKTEVAEPSPTLTTVPAEPTPPVTPPSTEGIEDTPVPPGYFKSKSGKIMKRLGKSAAAPAPEPVTQYSQLPNPIVRNPGGSKIPMMIQVVPQAKAKPAPIPKLLNPGDFLAKALAEIEEPLSADQEAEEAQAKADELKEIKETLTFELLQKIHLYHWDGGRVGRYIDKLQTEYKDIKLFDIIMSGDCSVITRYIEGDETEECLGEIADLYDARR